MLVTLRGTLLLVSALIAFTQSSAIAPFIYTLFFLDFHRIEFRNGNRYSS
ncbi:DUF5989 family protein [Nostoc sp.]